MRIDQLRQQFHASVLRYDVAYKQSTKSFLTETIGAKDTARDKVTNLSIKREQREFYSLCRA